MDLLEAIPEGWLWWFAGPEVEPRFSLFSNIPRSRWRESLELASTRLRRSLKGDFALERGSMRYLNATPRLVTTPAGILLVGDAAATLDPLLGRGIESTLGAAEAAAPAVNTILEHPELREECLRYQSNLEEQRYFSNLSQALGLYLREARYADLPFWSARHSMSQVEVETESEPHLPMKLRVADDVGRFPTLRRRGRLLERVVGMGRPGGPVHQTTLGIPVADLLRLVEEHHWTDEILGFARQHSELYVHSRAKLTRALEELCRLGLIESARDAANS